MAGRFSVDTVFGAKDEMSGAMGRMAAKATVFEKALGKANKFADKGAAMGKAVAVGAATATVGLGALAVSAGRTGADFEQAMSAVGAVGLQTRDQIAPLEKQALALGGSTVFSATQVANAMETMARAGFKNEEIMAGVGGVLDAAAASGLEIAEVANVVSNALKGMGLEANQASRVADVLALASSRTNSSIGTLGESMKNLAPVARQLNIPFEQAVASVALLQDVGLDASEAGTATATMLTKLAAPSKKAAAEMTALGISFQDAKGNALPLPGILKQFDAAAKKTGGNMKVLAFFSELVGLRGQKAALNLKDLFASGKLSTLSDELEKAKGSAGKMSALRLDNFLGDLEQLGGAVDSLKIGLFNTQAGPLRGIVQGMTEWVGVNQKLIESEFHTFVETSINLVDNLTDGLKDGFTDASAPIVKVGEQLGLAFGDESSGPSIKAYKLGKAIGDLTVAFGAYWLITKAVTAATFVWSVITGAAKLVQIAWTAAVTAARWAMFWWEFQSKAGAAATVAMSAASGIATVRLYAQAAAARVAAIGVGQLAKAAGVAALAYAAWSLAADQNSALKNENAGLGIGDLTWGLISEGKGFSEQVDEKMNREAKARRAKDDKDKAEKAKRSDPNNVSNAFDMASFATDGAAVPGIAGLQDQLKALDAMGGKVPAAAVGPAISPEEAAIQARMDGGAAGAVAAAGAPTPQGPPVVSLKEESTAALSQNLAREVKGALKGNVTVTIKDPGGQVDSAESSGDSLVLDHSGDF